MPTCNTSPAIRRTSVTVAVLLLIWIVAVIVTAQLGILSQLYLPIIAMMVAATIVIPTLWYFHSSPLQAWACSIGQCRIVAFHIWRIPAAIMFFYFGLRGELPVAFWVIAGIGDFIAGCYALSVTRQKQPTIKDYRRFHVVGFADFVVAVGTGFTYTVLQDPKMATITMLPMALIPLFGVGISGASHLISFDILSNRRIQ